MSVELNAFWHYYGGKTQAANDQLAYPPPKYDIVIEPFAGAAGYSTKYHYHKVILVDKYHVIAEIWKYLISATKEDIMKIPANELPFEHISEVGDIPEAMRWLIGFYMNKATVTPGLSLTAGQKRQRDDGKKVGWNIYTREKIANQVQFIKHWQAIEGDYWDAPDVEATWYIDPPYQGAGVHYKHNCKTIDFKKLGEWCQSRKGQVFVCENEGADWLPFRTLKSIRASNMTAGYDKQGDGLSHEVIWTNDWDNYYPLRKHWKKKEKIV